MLNKKQLALFMLLTGIFTSCAPVNIFTRLKKTPGEYTMNYCGEEIKAPFSPYNKQTWVVFSDREGNYTLQNPGGKVKMKDIGYLDAFFVTRRKGDYYKLVKYDPAIVNDNLFVSRIKDRKQAKYYGWIHRSRLLLTRQSETDIATGFKNKQLIIISDTTGVTEPEFYFVNDSIKIFKDPDLRIENGALPFYEIVYTLKTSRDGQKKLIARKPVISPDSVQDNILGWVHGSLIRNMGQRLYTKTTSVPEDSLRFYTKDNQELLHLSKQDLEGSIHFLRRNGKALKYSPVLSYRQTDTTVNIKTGIPGQVVDQSDNYVLNVNGNKITYGKFKQLEKDLKKLNVMFIFEGKDQVVENCPSIINVIQNLQPAFENNDDRFSYKFGAVIASQGETPDSSPLIKSVGMTGNYTDVIDYLIAETDSSKNMKPLPTQYTWRGVGTAVDMIEPYKDETNIFVIIGEEGYSEWADSVLIRRMSDANCRVLGFQMFSVSENAGNNFVLQIENMIAHCAERESIKKREKIVYVDQVKKVNRYRESSKNVYALDFPGRSMTQGWVLFPEKTVTMPLDILTNGIDSLISEVKWDNDNLVNSLYKAFGEVGNHRYRYDSVWVAYNHLQPEQVLDRKLPKMFTSQLPAWFLPAQSMSVADSVDRKIDYYLLLSKEEMDDLLMFMATLCENEVDYKYKGHRRKTRKLCNCPDDEITVEYNETTFDPENPEYLSTRMARKKLQDLYFDEIRYCKLCRIRKKDIRSYTLAKAQLRITGCPTYTSMTQEYIGNLRKKQCISDIGLDELITYFKQKKEGLDKYMNHADKFESNGQTYFWVHQGLLP
ncbi:MAG: hypothetical protein LBV74_09795 [Tannerella sp.]|jgi:hypothetical protein|nr:hypothetical protein [Tannerella sp.]